MQRYSCDRCGKSFSETQPLDGLRVDFKQACQVVSLLCESMGIRAISRVTGLHQATVLNILETAGEKAAACLDANVRGIVSELVQADEIHSFVYSKQMNTDATDIDYGDRLTFLAIAKVSKLIISAFVGERIRENAEAFMNDLKTRMTGQFQLTTDNWRIYSGMDGSVRSVFGESVDYATETKYFAKREYWLPRRLVGIRRHRLIGQPDMKKATTAHVERTNLSVRTFNRRFTRCTFGYSKKLKNHKHAVALFCWHFNFCRKHSAHGMTPAQNQGVTDHQWTVSELLEEKFSKYMPLRRIARKLIKNFA